jgi:hypothetical protein
MLVQPQADVAAPVTEPSAPMAFPVRASRVDCPASQGHAASNANKHTADDMCGLLIIFISFMH